MALIVVVVALVTMSTTSASLAAIGIDSHVEGESSVSSTDVTVRSDVAASGQQYVEFPAETPADPPAFSDPVVAPPVLPGPCLDDQVISVDPGNITSALTGLGPGQTLELSPGVYAISSNTVVTAEGSQLEPICVRPRDGPGTVTIRSGSVVKFTTASWWRIEGLRFNSRNLRLDAPPGQTNDFHFEFVDNEHTVFGLMLFDASHVAVRDSTFSYIRSGSQRDRHAVSLTGNVSRVSFTDNLCENPSADCIQSQGRGAVSDVLIEGNEFRINRPHPIEDPFCNTGENALDIKTAERWIVRNNLIHQWVVVDGCTNFESSSAAGESIVIHKRGARDVLIEGNTFLANTIHVELHGKGCIQGGTDCGSGLYTQNVVIRGNTFDNGTLVDVEGSAIHLLPGVGANSDELGEGQFMVTENVLIESNTFVAVAQAVAADSTDEFTYGQTEPETVFSGSGPATYEPGVAAPSGTTLTGNTLNGATIGFDTDIGCFGDQCAMVETQLDCATAQPYGVAAYTADSLDAGALAPWLRVRTVQASYLGLKLDEAGGEAYCERINLPDTAGAWLWVQAEESVVWPGGVVDAQLLGLGRGFDVDCFVLTGDVGFAPTSAQDCEPAPDPTPPNVAFTSPVDGDTLYSGDVVVTVDADDPDSGIAQVELVVDGDVNNPLVLTDAPWEFPLTGLADGPHQLAATATNGAGATTSASIDVVVSIDQSPPTVAFVSPADGDTLPSGDVVVTVDPVDPDSGIAQVELVVDGDANNPLVLTEAPWEFSLTGLADGPHQLSVTATNGAGLSAAASIDVVVSIDQSPPTVAFISPADGDTLPSGDVVVTVDPADPDSGIAQVELVVDGDANNPLVLTEAPWDFPLTGLADGPHQLSVTATNGAGLTAAASIDVTVDSADQTPPTVAFLGPSDGDTLPSGDVVVTVDPVDPDSGIAQVELVVDGDANNPLVLTEAPWEFSLTGLSDGPHQLSVTATNGAGLTTSVSIDVVVSIDQSPPTVAFVSPVDGDTLTSGDVPVTVDPDDPDSGIAQVELVVDGDANNPLVLTEAPWEFPLTGLADGPHQLSVTAINGAGLTTSTSITVTVDSSDQTPPTVAFISPSDGDTLASGDVLVTVDPVDPDSGISQVELVVDGDANNPLVLTEAPWEFSLTGLADGPHQLSATAINGAGLTTSASIDVVVSIDQSPPTIAFTSPSDGDTLPSGDVVVTVDPADPDSGISQVELVVDGDANNPLVLTEAPWEFPLTGLADGPHQLTATATNGAGLTTSVSIDVTVDSSDQSPPTVTFTSPADGDTLTSGDVLVTVDPADPDSGISQVELVVDGDANNPLVLTEAPWEFPLTGLTDGPHQLTATATNGDGLTTTTSIAVTVDSSDQSPPTVAFVSPADGDTLTSGDVLVTVDPVDPDSGIAQVELVVDGDVNNPLVLTEAPWEFPLTGLADGPHQLSVTATNGAGLTTSVSIDVTVDSSDQSPPTVTFTSPADGDTLTSGDVLVTVDPADPDSGISQVELVVDGDANNPLVLTEAPWEFPLTGLADGPHQLSVTATNGAGLTTSVSIDVTVDSSDQSPPTVVFVSPSDGDTLTSGDVVVTVDPVDPDSGIAQVELVVDGDVNNPLVLTEAPWEFPLTGLADGAHQLSVTATNGAGLTTSVSIAVTVDSSDQSPPTVAFVSPADGDTLTSSDVVVTVDPVDPDSGIAQVELVVDGDSNNPLVLTEAPWEFSLTGLADGAHQLTATATNGAGLTTSVSIAVTVDSSDQTPPTVTFVSPADGDTLTSGDVLVTVDPVDPDSGIAQVELVVDGDANNPLVLTEAPWEFPLTGLADGPHQLSVTATNGAGLDTSTSITVTVDSSDQSPPTVTFISPSDGDTLTSGDVLVTVDPVDPDSGIAQVELVVDGDANNPLVLTQAPWEFPLTGLADGPHQLSVTATNGAGLTTSVSIAVTVDSADQSPPTVAFISPSDGDTLTSGDVVVTVDPVDPDSGISQVELVVDGDSNNPLVLTQAPWEFPLTGLADGAHQLTATATNGAGLTASVSITVTVDSSDQSPPTVAFVSPVDGDTLTSGDVVVTVDPADPDSGISQVELVVDGDVNNPLVLTEAPWEFPLTGLADGPHQLAATATNGAGLDTTTSITVTVDSSDQSPPTVAFVSPVDGDTLTSGDMLVTVDPADPDSGISQVELVVDGDANNPLVLTEAPWEFPLTGLADGPHQLAATATNGAGLNTTTSITVTVDSSDQSPPTVAFISPSDGDSLTSGDVLVTVDPVDPDSGISQVELVVDGDANNPLVLTEAPWEFSLTGLADGPHQLAATATNGAGLDTSTSITVTVDSSDQSPPTVTFISPSDGDTLTSGDVLVTVDPVDLDSGISQVELVVDGDANNPLVLTEAPWEFSLTGLADGPHQLSVTATNGDSLSTSASIGITVATDPDVVNLAPNAGFEDNPTDDYFTNGRNYGSFLWDGSIAHTGTHSVRITGTRPAIPNRGARWISRVTRIDVVPGVTYTASAFVRTAAVVGHVEVGISYWRDSRTQLETTWFDTGHDGTNDWLEHDFARAAPANARYARIELRLRGTGDVWFDDVVFTDGTPAP